jgi:hypothetical protein
VLRRYTPDSFYDFLIVVMVRNTGRMCSRPFARKTMAAMMYAAEKASRTVVDENGNCKTNKTRSAVASRRLKTQVDYRRQGEQSLR